MKNQSKNEIQKTKKQNTVLVLIVTFFCVLLLFDRYTTLYFFGFNFTDIDQLVMWNGALNYSKGIFHEPFFYGQDYNYMLESLAAVPLLKLGVPIYQAMPIVTSFFTCLPYLVFAGLLIVKKRMFWACVFLSTLVLLPLDFNFLTTISRGFVQGMLFVPMLFMPLFYHNKKISLFTFSLGSGLCLVANPSTILIVFPFFVYYLWDNYKSISFYLNFLITIPLFIFDYFSKLFYKNNPNRLIHEINGVEFNWDTFYATLSNRNPFEYLFPIAKYGVILFFGIILFLGLTAYLKGKIRALLFILSFGMIVLVSLGITKVQSPYPVEGAGIFFSVSRFYILLPFGLMVSFYLVFKSQLIKNYFHFPLVTVVLIIAIVKMINTSQHAAETMKTSIFPTANVEQLKSDSEKIKKWAVRLKADLIVFKMSPSWSWTNCLNAYAFDPLLKVNNDKLSDIKVVNLNGDRRTWLYDEANKSRRVLMIGFNLDSETLRSYEYLSIEDEIIFIKNQDAPISTLFKEFDLQFGK
ncbi:hypothetical protein [Crocinitomix algicola]|uniref:hypothetical protein n=1 Tax=Crocinitomix algicola TaxID=1740263 RepID=UPI0008729859|nr:hypothetical protein [Crocinitomix algicola]